MPPQSHTPLTPELIRQGNERVQAFLDRSLSLNRAEIDAIADQVMIISLKDECRIHNLEVN